MLLQIVTLAASCAAFLFSLLAMLAAMSARKGGGTDQTRQIEGLRREVIEEIRASRQETAENVQSSVRSLGEMLAGAQGRSADLQSRRFTDLGAQMTSRQDTLQKTVGDFMAAVGRRLTESAMQSETKLDAIRAAVESRLTAMQEDNGRRLDQMRATVDEKLEKTLNERLSRSFAMVSERLEQVYKGLGEMQTLAVGVGDLKKVLSNVKTRGVLGEIQLGSILEQILSSEQYAANVATKPGSQAVVEYAVKLPGDGNGTVWLPIDAKFPADAYTALTDAYDTGDPAAIASAAQALDRRIRSFAKEIHDKYIDPPHTTDFGIMFLPFEGLYAEVVRRGLLETLARDYRITVAGPTTLAALLNSLQMGFRTLAIQKRSSEVWRVLGAVKTEFDKFGTVLRSAQQRLEQANSELDQLVGVRTRQIQRSLKDVDLLPEDQSDTLLGDADGGHT